MLSLIRECFTVMAFAVPIYPWVPCGQHGPVFFVAHTICFHIAFDFLQVKGNSYGLECGKLHGKLLDFKLEDETR